jgi:hypothetical protein
MFECKILNLSIYLFFIVSFVVLVFCVVILLLFVFVLVL